MIKEKKKKKMRGYEGVIHVANMIKVHYSEIKISQ
jgi:hypothetical protein